MGTGRLMLGGERSSPSEAVGGGFCDDRLTFLGEAR
jgi:hypothetical protein